MFPPLRAHRARGFGVLACLWLLGVCSAFSDVLVLSSGERLTGEVVSQKDGVIVFKHPVLGPLTVSAQQASIEAPAVAVAAAQADSAAQADAKADVAEQKIEENMTPSGGQVSAADGTSDGTQETQAEKDMRTRLEKWRDSVKAWFPKDLSGRLSIGYSHLNTGDTSENLDLGFLAEYKQTVDTYTFRAFYNYATSKNTSGSRSTTADKYGAVASYRHDLDERWFLINDAFYLRDAVLQINNEAQEVISIGYTFLKSENFFWNVSTGPSVRYVDAIGLNSHWFGLAVAQETMKYQITKALSFSQGGSYNIAPNNADNYAWSIYAGFTVRVTEWMDASLSYSYLENHIVGPQAQKNEERIMFGLGFPF